MTKKSKHKPFSELVKQIEAYGLKDKLADLAVKEQAKRPYRHLPKQFSKGILIGNIAIVPKRHTGTRYVYVIADMIEAKILFDDINLSMINLSLGSFSLRAFIGVLPHLSELI